MPPGEPPRGARRFAHYTIIPNAELDELVELHGRLAAAALLMHEALTRISGLSPYVSARPAIGLAREAIRAAEAAVAESKRTES
jgi:hypothetical protein